MTNQIILNGINLEQFYSRLEKIIEEKIHSQKPIVAPKDFISRLEVSKLLRISLPTLHQYTKEGWLKSYKIGSRVLYKRDEVHEALLSLKTATNRKGGYCA